MYRKETKHYDACVDRINDLAFVLNCLKEGYSFKLEGREFQSLSPAGAKLSCR